MKFVQRRSGSVRLRLSCVLPIAAVVFDRKLLIPWIGLFGWMTSRRVRSHSLVQRLGIVPDIPRRWLRVPAYVYLDAISALAGLGDALVPSLRSRW